MEQTTSSLKSHPRNISGAHVNRQITRNFVKTGKVDLDKYFVLTKQKLKKTRKEIA